MFGQSQSWQLQSPLANDWSRLAGNMTQLWTMRLNGSLLGMVLEKFVLSDKKAQPCKKKFLCPSLLPDLNMVMCGHHTWSYGSFNKSNFLRLARMETQKKPRSLMILLSKPMYYTWNWFNDGNDENLYYLNHCWCFITCSWKHFWMIEPLKKDIKQSIVNWFILQ